MKEKRLKVKGRASFVVGQPPLARVSPHLAGSSQLSTPLFDMERYIHSTYYVPAYYVASTPDCSQEAVAASLFVHRGGDLFPVVHGGSCIQLGRKKGPLQGSVHRLVINKVRRDCCLYAR